METLVCDSHFIRTIFCVVEDKSWDSNFQKEDSQPYT